MRMPIWAVSVACLVATTVLGQAAVDQAVIIQADLPDGGCYPGWGGDDREDELWNDCFLVFEMFYYKEQIGQDEDNIHMLWGEGYDYDRQGNRYYPERLDPDLHSLTDASPNIDLIDLKFQELAGMQQDETLFCYTWGHGFHNAPGPPPKPSKATHFDIIVRDEEGHYGYELWDEDFAAMLEPVDDPYRVFIMQQCHGGGFVDDLADSRTTIICATTAAKKSYSADNRSRNGSPWPEHEVDNNETWRHAEFNFHFLNAMRGTAIHPYDDPDPVDVEDHPPTGLDYYDFYYYDQDHESEPEEPVYYQPDMFWEARPVIPFDPKGKKLPVKLGAGLAEVNGAVYALKGNRTFEFWRYSDPDPDDYWVQMPYLPSEPSGEPVFYGGELTSDGVRYVYALKGNRTRDFYRFDTEKEFWEENLQQVPEGTNKKIKQGSSIVYAYDSQAEEDVVFCLKGGRRSGTKRFEFWRYSVNGNSWTPMNVPVGPKKFKYGSALAWDGSDYIYALAGQVNGEPRVNNPNFLRYHIPTGEWKPPLPSLPAKPKWGGALSYSYVDNSIYALQGGNKQGFWRYQIVPGEEGYWTSMAGMPLGGSHRGVKRGGSLVYLGGMFYALKGNRTYEFWRYLIPTGVGDPAPPPPPDPQEYPDGTTPVVEIDGDDPQWSPNGQLVAFSRLDDVSGYIHVYTKEISSGIEVCITPGVEADCEYPQWHPNGQEVVFEMCDHASYTSQIASADLSGNVTQWTSTPVDHECPRFTPYPYMVIYVRTDEDGVDQLYRINAPNQPEVQLSFDQTDRAEPYPYQKYVWENGALVIGVVYERDDEEGFSQIHKMLLSTIGVVVNDRQLTQGSTHKTNPCPYSEPVSMVDFVVYESEDEMDVPSIWKVPGVPPHTAILLLEDASKSDLLAPAVSANGQWACLERWKGEGTEVVEVATNGSGQVYALTDDELIREGPQYSIDGTIVVSCEVPYRGKGRGAQGTAKARPVDQARVVPALVCNSLPLGTTQSGILLDISGRKVADLEPGDNNVSHVAPGVYFVRLSDGGTASKVLIQR